MIENPKKYPGPERRRRFLLNVQVQLGTPFTVVLIAVIGINLIFLSLALVNAPAQQAVLNPWYPLAVAAIEAVLLAVALLYSLLTGKRVIGPVYGVRRVLRSVASGDLSARVAVRDGEYFEDLIGETNEALDTLEDRIIELRRICAEIDTDGASRDELIAELSELGARLNDIGLSCDEAAHRKSE